MRVYKPVWINRRWIKPAPNNIYKWNPSTFWFSPSLHAYCNCTCSVIDIPIYSTCIYISNIYTEYVIGMITMARQRVVFLKYGRGNLYKRYTLFRHQSRINGLIKYAILRAIQSLAYILLYMYYSLILRHCIWCMCSIYIYIRDIALIIRMNCGYAWYTANLSLLYKYTRFIPCICI